MIIHRADSRGAASTDWLSTYYSFSFADWFNPERMGFGALRVLNDDTIAPHSGFSPHSHQNMEIITIVTSGTITHSDNMGNESTKISSGEVQVMSAGTGVTHAEYNKEDEPLTLFQIWIFPNEHNIKPRYAQKQIDWGAPGITHMVGPTTSNFPLHIHQDAYISSLKLDTQESFTYTYQNNTHGLYVFVVEGSITIENETLAARDAAGIPPHQEIHIAAHEPTTLLLFEVPLTNAH